MLEVGKTGREILNLDVEALIDLLNKALSEEWLAFYQYWVGARIMEGPMRTAIEGELLLHADQELNHAVMVADRIVQLGGTPVVHPREWFERAGCAYLAPEDPYIEVILDQNLEGERCAIKRYKEISDLTQGKDHFTHQMAITIMGEELEHEQEIEDWLTDIGRMKENIKALRP